MAEGKPAQEPAKEHRPADWFREAWSQALVAVGAAEDEANQLLHRAGELADWKPEDARRFAKELADRLAAQRKELEKTLDERVARAVGRIKIPNRDVLDSLAKRVGHIAQRIEVLEARRK